jgi:hypothetical protein
MAWSLICKCEGDIKSWTLLGLEEGTWGGRRGHPQGCWRVVPVRQRGNNRGGEIGVQ